MSDTSSPSEQHANAKIIRPRLEPDRIEAWSLTPADAEEDHARADPEESLPEDPANGLEDSGRPYKSFEDLPQALRDEFIALADDRHALRNYFIRKGVSPHDADEHTSYVHQALITQLISGKTVRSSLKQYAYGTARYTLWQHWRGQKRQIQQMVSDMETVRDNPASIMTVWESFDDSVQFSALFKRCTETLSPYQITVFYLRSIADLSYAMIGELLDRSVPALRACHKTVVDKIWDDPIAIADLRLASQHSAYTETDIKEKPKRTAKKAAKARKPR